MTYDNFTAKAQEAIQKGQQIASGLSHQQVETIHLLKGIMETDESLSQFLDEDIHLSENFILEGEEESHGEILDRVFPTRTPDDHVFQLLHNSFVMGLGQLLHVCDVHGHSFIPTQYKIFPRVLETLHCEGQGLGFDPLVDQFMFLTPHVMARSTAHRSK